MTTVGYNTFDDEAARAWLRELAAGEGTAFLEQSLLPEADDEAALGYTEAVGILAASEIVAALLNGPREGLPAEARSCRGQPAAGCGLSQARLRKTAGAGPLGAIRTAAPAAGKAPALRRLESADHSPAQRPDGLRAGCRLGCQPAK